MKGKIISKKMKIFLFIIFISSLFCYLSGFILLFSSKYTVSEFTRDMHSLNLSKLKLYLGKNDSIFSFSQSSLTKEYELKDSIDSIYINLTCQNVKVNSYDGDNIRVQIKGTEFFNISELSQYEVDSALTFFSPSDTLNSSLDIVIDLPKKIINDYNIDISTNSGDIDVNYLSIDSLNCSTDYGDISLNNINTNYLNVKDFSGDVTLNKLNSNFESSFTLNNGDFSGNGCFGFINANSASGDILLDLSNITNDIYITSVSGDVNLNVPDSSNYKVDYSSLSGKLNSPISSPINEDNYNIIHIKTISSSTYINCK